VELRQTRSHEHDERGAQQHESSITSIGVHCHLEQKILQVTVKPKIV
jgi:hypothetical protein